MHAAAEPLPERLTLAQFLAFLDARPHEKWELYAGVPVAMAGGSDVHSALAVNILAALTPRARQRGCHTRNSDFLVVGPPGSDFAAYPDAWVRCGPPLEPSARGATDPVIVVEVLSPSTMADDRGYKFKQYQAIDTVQQIVLVYPDERRVESWQRSPASDQPVEPWRLPEEPWSVSVHNDGDVPLPALATSLAVAAIYDGVEVG